ncbi:hypothetical protein AAKU55_005752 [Oxalobacteraceae bacterium GrIS 1.11]
MLFGVIVATFLALWWAVSALNQIAVVDLMRIKRWDLFSLIPKWTFFAPNPATTDYHLLTRDLYADGTVSVWAEVPLGRQKGPFTPIWNPDKRLRKVLIDVMRALTRIQRSKTLDHDRELIRLSMNYLLLLGFVSALPAPPMTKRRQFMVLQRSGFFPSTAARVALASEFHLL